MIVVVEGISAAGKSSWCRAHAAGHVVEETAPRGPTPDRGRDPAAWAAFWIERNAERWRQAREMADRTGRAVCDIDPLKLHYSFGLWRIGVLASDDWRLARDLTRAAISGGRLGFADLFLFKPVDPDQARLQRDADASRRRRSFDLHVRLGPPLEEWYRTIEALLPGSVIWQWPEQGMSAIASPERPVDVEVFDALMDRLGG